MHAVRRSAPRRHLLPPPSSLLAAASPSRGPATRHLALLAAVAIVLFLAAAPAPGDAEPYDDVAHTRVDVPVTIEQTTTFGTSVFLLGDTPELGNGDAARALRLSPAAYPVWSATVSLPRGAAIGAQFIFRSDAPGDLPDASNATPIGDPFTITTDAPWSDYPVRLAIRQALVGAPEVALAAADGTPIDLYGPTSSANGWSIVEVPRRLGATYRVLAGSTDVSGLLPLAFGHSYVVPIPGGGAEARDYPSDGTLSARRIVTTDSITSTILGNTRTLRVYLPRGYDTFPDRRYPVLYMHDGQNIFRPGGPFGTWAIEDALDAAIRTGAIPQLVVVGIDNTNDRLREYMPPYTTYQGAPGIGDQYASFLVDEVLPFIEARYRVATTPDQRGIAGSSLGGLISMYVAWERPDVFGRVASLSGSFWLDEIVGVIAQGPRRPLRIYLDSGNLNQNGTTTGNPDSIHDTNGLRDTLLGLGYVVGRDLHHTIGYGHRHNEAAWEARSPGMLRALFPAAEFTRRPGDVNGNGLFEVGDLVAIVNLRNGATALHPSPHAAAYADMDGNGAIDLLDADAAAHALLGIAP